MNKSITENNIYIYMPLMGRIGNQLFEYAFAYTIQQEYGFNPVIVMNEEEVINSGWINSLRDYDLPNIEYVCDHNNMYWKGIRINRLAFKLYNKLLFDSDPQVLYFREKKYQKFLNRMGLIAIAKGYADYELHVKRNSLIYGYYQSERFFNKYKESILNLFDISDKLESSDYPFVSELKNRNSVCISIKIEHNLGSSIYDVCGAEYYRKAIDYIRKNVDSPLFFLCSDNIELAKKTFFKDFDADIICQPDGYPASLTLCAMSKCRHFVINNTSFGWWAQYMSQNEDRIVIAPNRWMNNTDPVSIYDNQDTWHLIEV